ncbi:MAG TPA: PD-(D/E)XK nuclease family protein [Noviherbaspirillum sp.]|nr:PD-(D/E)XK nuclease family protein [Noviherbaspirillum sp.]
MTTRSPVILCATSRLVQALRSIPPQVDASVWPTPFAVTPDQWFSSLAEEAVLAGLLPPVQTASPYAETVLWETVIEQSLEGAAALFDVPGMAATAAQAHGLVMVWGKGGLHDDASEEVRTFTSWLHDWRKQLKRHQWTTRLDQQLAVVELIEQGKLSLPLALTFAGFDRLNPVLQRLEKALTDAAVTVTHVSDGNIQAATAVARRFPDMKAECLAVASWAAETLTASPQARLGIIAPDVNAIRGMLSGYLDDLLHPELTLHTKPEVPRRYNFSLGRPLSESPLAATALDLLRWLCQPQHVRQSDVSGLLRSPYWSEWEREADDWARLDAKMRESLGFFTGLDSIVGLGGRLAEKRPWFCAGLFKSLKDLQQAITANGQGKRYPSEWRGVFKQWLELAGWPGSRKLTSAEHQARVAFGDVLAGLDELDPVLHRIPAAYACTHLVRLCQQRVFQARTVGTPGVQVLGMLESVGLRFDAVWVLGMNDHAWPVSPRPNPLLCMAWQRQERMPHSSAAVELEFAQHVHERLLRSAPHVTFSFSNMDGNKLLRPSPLIAGIPVEESPAAPAATPAAAPARLERIMDDKAPPVEDGEKVYGGTWVLRAQAICPAWAFYQYRLGAKALKAPVEGVDAAGRGTLVHCALQAFWTRTKTSQAFKAMSEAQLKKAINAAVEAGITLYETNRDTTLQARFRALEHARLVRLLSAWLEVERRREADFTVEYCEHLCQVSIGGIEVKMSIDRVDVLEDGRQVVIDYKTGYVPGMDSWASDRITEPQLPIYASIAMAGEDNPVKAVVFARVVPDKAAFSGVAEEAKLLPGVKYFSESEQFPPDRFPGWQSVLAHWEERLNAIAEEIKAGHAGVWVKDESELEYADVKPVLRLAERRQQMEELRSEQGAVTMKGQA